MDFEMDIDWDEAFEYVPGTMVELKNKPGIVDTVVYYEPMMVPPIWLMNDQQPHYPHELNVVSKLQVKACSLQPQLV